jgi:hypothetical protein
MALCRTTFRRILLNKLVEEVTTNLIPSANSLFPKYVLGVNSRCQPMNVNFQNIATECAAATLREMGIKYGVAVSVHSSDTPLVGDDFYMQLDSKGSLWKDGDFMTRDWSGKNKLVSTGLQVHLGPAQHSRDFTHLLNTTRTELVAMKKPVQGKQLREINGKPVYIMISFLKWGFTEERGYFADSVGIAEFPHENDVYAVAGKTVDKEMRFIITNPDLYLVHTFVAESVPQTQDSVPSSSTEPQVAELPTQ